MADNAPRRLDTRHLRNHAGRAVADRLRYAAPEAVRAVERDGDAVVIRLNSGGNALAVESWLKLRGYRAEFGGGNPDGYGCAVRVTLRTRPAPAAASFPVLTVRQPWCSAIVYGDKRTENRPKYMGYRGPLWLHAGLTVEWDAPFHAWMAAGVAPYSPGSPRKAWKYSLTLGAVMGLATVTGCHHADACYRRGEGFCQAWAVSGQFHIELAADVRLLHEPAPCRGMLGLWRLPSDVEAAARTQLEAARA